MKLFGGKDKGEEEGKGLAAENPIDRGMILKLFLVLLALIVGAVVQHYLIEPLLEKQAESSLTQCRSSLQLLNQELDQCYQQNIIPNRSASPSEEDLNTESG